MTEITENTLKECTYGMYINEEGYSGQSGWSGFSGFSGASGLSGFSGISGWSGAGGGEASSGQMEGTFTTWSLFVTIPYYGFVGIASPALSDFVLSEDDSGNLIQVIGMDHDSVYPLGYQWRFWPAESAHSIYSMTQGYAPGQSNRSAWGKYAAYVRWVGPTTNREFVVVKQNALLWSSDVPAISGEGFRPDFRACMSPTGRYIVGWVDATEAKPSWYAASAFVLLIYRGY